MVNGRRRNVKANKQRNLQSKIEKKDGRALNVIQIRMTERELELK